MLYLHPSSPAYVSSGSHKYFSCTITCSKAKGITPHSLSFFFPQKEKCHQYLTIFLVIFHLMYTRNQLLSVLLLHIFQDGSLHSGVTITSVSQCSVTMLAHCLTWEPSWYICSLSPISLLRSSYTGSMGSVLPIAKDSFSNWLPFLHSNKNELHSSWFIITKK